MADEFRICSKTGCSQPVHASLSFRYGTRQVWVTSLTAEPEASCYDLCAAHADTLTVPQGWHRIDERGQTVRKARRGRAAHRPTVSARTTVANGRAAPPAPSRAAPPPETAGPLLACAASCGGRDRYAALRAELPRLAAEIGTTVPAAEEARRPAEDDARAEVEGQLAIPAEPSAHEAVVVSIDQFASARRGREGRARVRGASQLSPEPAGS